MSTSQISKGAIRIVQYELLPVVAKPAGEAGEVILVGVGLVVPSVVIPAETEKERLQAGELPSQREIEIVVERLVGVHAQRKRQTSQTMREPNCGQGRQTLFLLPQCAELCSQVGDGTADLSPPVFKSENESGIKGQARGGVILNAFIYELHGAAQKDPPREPVGVTPGYR